MDEGSIAAAIIKLAEATNRHALATEKLAKAVDAIGMSGGAIDQLAETLAESINHTIGTVIGTELAGIGASIRESA